MYDTCNSDRWVHDHHNSIDEYSIHGMKMNDDQVKSESKSLRIDISLLRVARHVASGATLSSVNSHVFSPGLSIFRSPVNGCPEIFRKEKEYMPGFIWTGSKAKWVVQTKIAIFSSQLLGRLFDCQCKFEKFDNWATRDSSSSFF